MRRPARALFLLFASVSFACMIGCGAAPVSSSSAPVAAPSAAYLSGNWLLAGSLPVFPSTGTTLGANPSFGLAATFDVAGNRVTGIVTEQVSCNGFTSVGGVGVVAGTVADDGSFTLTTQIVNPNSSSVTLTGKAPTASGGAWTGTYAVTRSSGTCSGSSSGAIGATSLPPVTGTYGGTSSFDSVPGASASPVTLKLALQQGGSATNVLGTSLQSNTVLTGAITVQGSSCYTSGVTTNSPIPGAVEGNSVIGIFSMNDGSILQMLGTTASTDSTKLSVDFLTTTTGTCPAVFSGATALSR